MNTEQQDNSTELAVIGMGGRFPGAKDIEQFRENLRRGHESIRFLSDEELIQRGVAPEVFRAPRYVRAAAAVEGIEHFDNTFFGFIPRDAEIMDPQLRLLLECAWSTLEHAGCNPEDESRAIGVFTGAGPNSYFQANLLPNAELMRTMHVPLAPLAIYTTSDALSTMVSFKLNLRGPSITVQTACSTSLVAVHLACQSLLSGECDLALAGGVNLNVPQEQGYFFQDGMILSPDGHCRPFDANAAGTLFSDGLGLVLLKRLADALADGDCIHAVIRGSALNNDGSQKAGFTAPSVVGQAAAMAEALSVAGVSADSISYVEAHGTGTALGDPIEIEALTRAFRRSSKRNGYCGIGSVKSNIGHLDRAAGVASLIKTILALEDRQIPPTLHFTRPNPKIDFASSPFRVIDQLTAWENGATPRRAAVNSVGFGGTNACVVLEEAPPRAAPAPSRSHQLLVLSARTEAGLELATRNLAAHFANHPDINLADAAHTLQSGRVSFDFRRTLVCRDAAEAVAVLNNPNDRRGNTGKRPAVASSIVFMFPGQGAQYVGMGQGLFDREPVFRSVVDRCAKILEPHLGLDVRTVLYPAADRLPWAEEKLREIRLAQPALFVVEYALAKLWMSWGVQPAAMVGHSVGEFVAACVSGVFTLEDALGLVALRARLVQEQPTGAMLAVRLPEDGIAPLLHTGLAIAAVNSPSLTVVSGPTPAVEALEEKLATQRVACRHVQTSHAFHSAMVEPVVAPFTERLKSVVWSTPKIQFASNVTGRWATAAEVTRPEYWAAHLRGAVRFRDGVAEVIADQARIFLEVGPGQSLGQMVRQNPAKRPDTVVLASLGTTQRETDEVQSMLETLGRAWISGTAIDWRGFYASERRHRVPLPTYPFEKKRFWIEPAQPGASTASANATPATIPATVDTANGGPQPPPPPIAVGTPRQETAADSGDSPALGKLKAILQELSGMAAADLQDSVTFLEMGLDSLFLAQFSRRLETEFGLSISFGQLADELPTLGDLARHIENHLRGVAPPNRPTSAALSQGTPAPRALQIQSSLRDILHRLSGLNVSALRESVTFLELGLDSLFLAQYSAAIEREFGVSVGFAQLADNLSTLRSLARHLEELLPESAPPPSGPTADLEATLEVLREKVRSLYREIERLQRAGVDRPLAAVPKTATISAEPPTEGIATRMLTAGQREIWLASQISENASRAYNELVLLHMRGDLQVPALEAALQEIVNRHDALRATFSPDGDQFHIHAMRRQELGLLDLSNLADNDRDARVRETIEELGQHAFDLTDGPLMKVHLIRCGAQDHLLHLGFHHVVVDGWSTHVVASELGRIYTDKVGGTTSDSSAVMAYRDYVDWYHRKDNTLRRAEDDRFWMKSFADRPEAVDLPITRSRPVQRTHRAGHASMIVDQRSYRQFKKASASLNATLFHFLLASFHAWLHRVTRQTDIIVGVPVAGHLNDKLREFPGSHRLVGHLANLLPVRTKSEGDIPFHEMVVALKRQMLQRRAHEALSYGELVEKLNLPRDPSRVPLVSVTFNLNDNPPLDWDGLQVEAEVPPLPGIFFDLEVNIWESSKGLRVAWYYASDLVDPATVERWLLQWRTLMLNAAEAPQSRIDELAILDPVERERLLFGLNQTAASYPRDQCVHQWFESQAARTPDAVALEFEGQELTYGEMNRRANRLARLLRQNGVGPDILVGVFAERSFEMVLSLLAVLKAGGAYVPLDPSYPAERLGHMLEDARAPLVLAQPHLASRLPAGTAEILLLDASWGAYAGEAGEDLPDAGTPRDLAYVIFTSGSTGRPKGAMNEHRGICNWLRWMQEEYGLTRADRVLQKTPYSFDVSLREFFWPLVTGARMVIARPEGHRDSAYLVELIRQSGITTLHFVPSMLRVFLEQEGVEACRSLKRVMCSGEVLSYELQERFFARLPGVELHNLYGPTEAAVEVTHWACRRGDQRHTVPIGRPVANTQMYVLDGRMEPVPVGIAGELYIGGVQVGRGYVRRDELTAERFVPDPFSGEPGARLYKTGDLARYLSDGAIEYLGRTDFQVKIRGQRIELGEIEATLDQHAKVGQSVVVAREDSPGDQRLVAYVVPRQADLCAEELREHLRKHLPPYMVPSAFVLLEELPLTWSGKVDRKALPEPERTNSEASYTAPRTATEEVLAGIWAEVLTLARVGIHDNLFDLGGHSLLAMRVISRTRSALGCKLTLRALFDHPTVAGLAKAIHGPELPAPDSSPVLANGIALEEGVL